MDILNAEKRIVNVRFTQKVSGCGSWRKQQYEIIQYRRQAVMEGVMMRNADKYAVAVRKTDGEIVVKTEEYKGIVQNKKIRSLPIIRGVFSFIDSMVLGMSTLTYSASFFYG